MMRIDPVTKETFSAFTSLWQQAFGDTPDAICRILDCLGTDQQSWVLMDHGHVCSALTQFYMGDLILPDCCPQTEKESIPDDGQSFSVPVLVSYAISTDPKERDHGYGSRITSYAQKEAGQRGAVSMLSPAEPDLISFYEPLGYRPLFTAETLEIFPPAENIRSGSMSEPFCHLEKDSEPVRITAEEYFSLREQYLQSFPHIRLSKAAQKLAVFCCDQGGFYLFEKEKIIFTMERNSHGMIQIPELLCEPPAILSAASNHYLPAELLAKAGNLTQQPVEVSIPALRGSGTAFTQAMISFEGLPEEIRHSSEALLKDHFPAEHAYPDEFSGYAPYFGFTFG